MRKQYRYRWCSRWKIDQRQRGVVVVSSNNNMVGLTMRGSGSSNNDLRGAHKNSLDHRGDAEEELTKSSASGGEVATNKRRRALPLHSPPWYNYSIPLHPRCKLMPYNIQHIEPPPPNRTKAMRMSPPPTSCWILTRMVAGGAIPPICRIPSWCWGCCLPPIRQQQRNDGGATMTRVPGGGSCRRSQNFLNKYAGNGSTEQPAMTTTDVGYQISTTALSSQTCQGMSSLASCPSRAMCTFLSFLVAGER